MRSSWLLWMIAFAIPPVTGSCVHAQTTYDVSTVKPAKAGETGMMLNWGHAQLTAKNVSLAWMLTVAFDVRRDQVVDAPGWAKEDRFDIMAKLTGTDAATVDNLTVDQRRALMLSLLAERFGLKYHVETKEMTVYDLAPAKDGLKLTPAADSGDKTKSVNGMCSGCLSSGSSELAGHDIDVPVLAKILGGQMEREVHDRTGFSGKIDVKMKWAPDLGSRPASDDDAALPPLPEVLEKQMGLRLVPGKGPVKLYVIDHLDKPSAD